MGSITRLACDAANNAIGARHAANRPIRRARCPRPMQIKTKPVASQITCQRKETPRSGRTATVARANVTPYTNKLALFSKTERQGDAAALCLGALIVGERNEIPLDLSSAWHNKTKSEMATAGTKRA